ncbi:hypothetical protein CH63R_05598 [Colletotrichum higginsianum IMI 349063]|uniref:Uncharacterized protein n=1 Tax=Colletotrichum higginsianum (strain IMI 349063) TaxID=759273 RepID=A0A1B7YCW7_COLHI|nr:hypothetical protein CH63R_05598 [Colletotrichum higginsianum IMI 349063]OBR09906.1 hypothetical protein CH63R_05598 [Colletotrichum higginsianum IMI 349063]
MVSFLGLWSGIPPSKSTLILKDDPAKPWSLNTFIVELDTPPALLDALHGAPMNENHEPPVDNSASQFKETTACLETPTASPTSTRPHLDSETGRACVARRHIGSLAFCRDNLRTTARSHV